MNQLKIEEGAIDEYVDKALNEFKGRFGKFVGVKDEMPADEPVAQEGGEAPEIEMSIEAKDAGGEAPDLASALMDKMMKIRKGV
jgi:hypothetical protein